MAIDPIYIHPVLGELTLAEVQDNAAYEEMSLDDYLSAFEVTLKAEEEEPVGTGTVLKNEEIELDSFYDPSKKVPVVAAEDADAATEIDETSKLELELEGILSEYKKVENNFFGDKYNGSRAGKMLLDERYSNVRSKLKKAYQSSEMDINKPMSIIDKTEEEVQSFLMNQYPGVYIEQTGVRNALNITLPGENKSTELDLQPFTLDGRDEAVDILKKLDEAYKNQTDEELVINTVGQLADVLGETKDDRSINKALKGTGYSVSVNAASGSIKDGTNQPYSYNVIKDGNVIKEKLDVSELRSFMTDDLGKEGYAAIMKNSYEATSNYLETKARDVKKEETVIKSDKSLDLKYFKNTFADDIIANINQVLPEGLSSKEQEQIKDYMENNAIGEMVYNAKLDKLVKAPSKIEDNINKMKDLSGLPQTILDKIQQAGGIEFIQGMYKAGIENLKKEELLDRSRTIGEKIMSNSGNQNLIRLGQGIAGIEKNKFDQRIKEQVKELPKIYEERFGEVLNTRAKEILKNAPRDTKLSIDYTPSGDPVFSLINDRNLSAEEGILFKETESQIFKLQNDFANLQSDYSATLDNMQQEVSEFYAANPVNADVFKDSMKEYGLGNLFAKDVNDAFAGILLAAPTLVNSDWALEAQKRLNAKNDYFETMGSYSDGDFGTFFFRTLGQQSGNITLAIATGGIGSAAGLSSAMTANAIGGLFGLSSGTQTYRDLKTQQQIVGTADKQAKIALDAYENGVIDLYTYTNTMRDINKTRAMSEISDDQIVSASLANGIIEGTVTRFLGTAPNTIKLLKDFKAPTSLTSVSKNLYANKYEKIADLIGKPLLMRGSGELAEEELIYGGQQFITEYGILDREIDLSAWDDTAMSTIITLGVSQSPGVAYSGMVNYNATKDFEKKINKLRINNNELSVLIQDSKLDAKQKKLLLSDMAENLKEQGLEVDRLGVDILGRNASDIKRLIGTELIKSQILAQAGVMPGMSDVDKAEVIKSYKESLTKEQAKVFETQLTVLDKQINAVKDKPTNLAKAKESLGSIWTTNDSYLSKTNKDGYNEKSTEDKLVAVINQVRESVSRSSKKAAKANPDIVAMVESETINGKPLNKKQKEIRYRELGDLMALNQSRAISVAEGVNAKAADIFADIDNVNIVEYKTAEELETALLANGVEVNTPEYNEAIEKFNNNGTYGAVIGNTIVTQDAAQAKKDIDNGEIRAGTVIIHEFAHIVDDARIKPENRKIYAENLAAAAASTNNQAIKAVDKSVRNMLDNLYSKDNLTFENSDKYRDEYTKYMQESLYAFEDEVQIEKEDNFMTRIFNGTDPNNLNTPEKALDYLAANNAAFRSGKISKKTKKAISNYKGDSVKYSDKSTVNKLALEYKKDPTAFRADKAKFTDFFKQAQSVAINAMGYNVAKGDIMATEAEQFVATEIESVMKTFDSSKGVFTTHVFNSFQNRRANKFYKQEFGPKDIKQTRIGEGFDIESQDLNESLDDRKTREDSETVSKIDPRKFRVIGPDVKKLEDLVNISQSDIAPFNADFKSIASKFGAKLAESMYGISNNKISKNANLTYAKKIVNGIPESSEAGRIQDDFNNDQEVRKFLKLLPPTNVTSRESEIKDTGEKIPVSADVQGRSIGLKGRVLDYFYDAKTKERSSGLSSQPFIRRLKPQFKGNITTETIKKLQEDMGITPRGELNVYDRNIGTFLNGIAKLKGSIIANTIARDKAAKLEQRSSRSPKQIQADMGAGRSGIQFSEKVKSILSNPTFKLETRGVDGLLKAYNIDGTFKFKTREDVDKYVAEVKKNLLPLMPRAFWFGKGGGTVFTPTSKVLGKNEKDLYYDYYVDQMKALGNSDLNPNQKYGEAVLIDGKPTDFSVSGYDTLFKTVDVIKAKTKSGDIATFNKKVSKIHQAMWYRFNKAIQSDKQNARVIGNYLKITGSDTGHWHKMGAQFVGYSNKITGSRFEYEHAMPATAAYLYLLDVSLSRSAFESAYDFVIDNYKLISLDKAMDKKLIAVGLRSEMPVGWNLLDNKWFDRYFSELVATVDGGIDPRGLISIDGTNFQEKYNINADGSPYIRGTFKPEAKSQVKKDNIADKAMKNARSPKYSEKIKKARVFDFDDTLAKSNSKVLVETLDGNTFKINATEFAKRAAELEQQGAKFDFTEFEKVIDGKKGPLFEVAKKIQDVRGSEDIFVLTARPQNADKAIKNFLSSLGLNIPLANITGLSDGKPQAKADWMLGKFAEGYNDFYFTDDAMKNVKAVRDVLSVLDVKSKVQQARIKFSEKLSDDFNAMIERNKGVKAEATFSDALARRRGVKQKRFSFFIPPSADDFRGLTMYTFAGKGKQGEMDQDFFDKALIKPYMRGIGAVEQAKQRITNDYKALVKKYPKIKKKLRKKFEGTKYSTDEAVRIFLWDRAGYTIPGLSKTDQAEVVKLVSDNTDLTQFADGVELVTRLDNYVEPTDFWDASTIIGDLSRIGRDVNRKEYLAEFIENVDTIFSPENLNKVQAVYGFRIREALEDSIRRMKSGNNKTSGGGRLVESWNNWVNNSVGAIMFFNRRSALLQLMSSANFINWSDNNPAQAALALANQPQYWKDVIMLFNSPKLKQRRSGLEGDIQEAEIAQASKKGGMTGVISYLLKIGFTPTQIADSIAISTGGATFYRNRVNTYKKDGFETADAEAKAFEDFSSISDETQQSADPMLISGQQSSVLGRLILAFQNTPMQYTRLIKKAGLDLINGRGSKKQNISKILYYGAIQNFIFNALQNALFALVPGFDDEDEDFATDKDKEKYDEKKIRAEENKIGRIANGMVDSIVRGSGLAGAVLTTVKNTIREFIEYQEKPVFARERGDIVLAALQISPPIGSKARKINTALQTLQYEKDVIDERGFDVMIDGKFQLSPTYNMIGSLSAATLNLPLDRAVDEINSITEALDTRNTQWQRIALGLGWRSWDTGVKIEEHDLIKTKAKAARKEAGKEKAKETRKINKQKTKEYKAYRSRVLRNIPVDIKLKIQKEEKDSGKTIPAFKLQILEEKYLDLK
jgi:hypothetical protein